MAQNLEGRRALVIGAGTAAGRAIALALAAAGADVAVASATTSGEEVMAARRTRRAVEALGRRSAEYAFDTALGQNVQVSTRQVSKEMGGLDILVNAQDYRLASTLERTSDADWSRTIALNLGGVFFACRAVVREMAAAGGTIVNVLPGPDPDRGPDAAAYAAARAGVVGLTEALAREYGARNIYVVTITVGAPESAAGTNVRAGRAAEMGLPAQVGTLAAYLAAERPPHLNGSCIAIDQRPSAT